MHFKIIALIIFWWCVRCRSWDSHHFYNAFFNSALFVNKNTLNRYPVSLHKIRSKIRSWRCSQAERIKQKQLCKTVKWFTGCEVYVYTTRRLPPPQRQTWRPQLLAAFPALHNPSVAIKIIAGRCRSSPSSKPSSASQRSIGPRRPS